MARMALDALFGAYLIMQWIFFSSTIILFNKHILSGMHFPYPATLVLLHSAPTAPRHAPHARPPEAAAPCAASALRGDVHHAGESDRLG